ncbi:MAG: hypothetical protein ACI4D8_02520 [Wujia sp.]
MRRKKLYKNILRGIICVGLASSLVGCGDKNNNKIGSDSVAVATTEESDPTIAMITTESTSESVTESTTESTTEITTEDTDGTDAGEEFSIEHINTLTSGTEGWTEQDWLTWAVDMHQRACEVYFENETVSNLWVNGSETINIDGIEYYLCDNYSNMEEATADFYSLFSKDKYADFFDGLLAEQDGKLYVVPLGRGSDVYYMRSEIVSLDRIGEYNISFTVNDYYLDPEYAESEDLENHLYMETREFSVVFEDRIWKIDDFILPY